MFRLQKLTGLQMSTNNVWLILEWDGFPHWMERNRWMKILEDCNDDGVYSWKDISAGISMWLHWKIAVWYKGII